MSTRTIVLTEKQWESLLRTLDVMLYAEPASETTRELLEIVKAAKPGAPMPAEEVAR